MVLCPFCGHKQAGSVRCERCRGLFEPLSRKATQIAMGPWYIRDEANPFRPGCSYETLKRQIEAGRVKPQSIIRGPTTRQFWSLARNVPGVAHLVGACHCCEARVQPTAPQCPTCGERFRPVPLRNELGLLYPNVEAAEQAQRELDQQRRAIEMGFDPATAATAAPSGSIGAAAVGGRTSPGPDLLDQVLQTTTTSATTSSSTTSTTTGPSAAAAASPSIAGPASGPPPTGLARPSAAPDPAASPAPQPLDFTPSPHQAAEESTASGSPALSGATSPPSVGLDEASGPHRSAALIWLLVLLNALAAAAVVLLAWHFVL